MKLDSKRTRYQLHVGTMGEKFKSIKTLTMWPDKPEGGFWTSTMYRDNTSDWSRWCNNNGYKEAKMLDMSGWIFEIKPTARILSIKNPDEVKVFRCMFYNKYKNKWENMVKDWDGVHVEKGYLLDAWDVESTVWFNEDHIVCIHETPTQEGDYYD